MDPKDYVDQVGPSDQRAAPAQCASCMAAITFSDEDLQLGDEFHNRPLYVMGMVGDKSINRILLDCGLAVNLLPYKVLKAIWLTTTHLSPTLLTIQGFN